jgi:hypothetical protein
MLDHRSRMPFNPQATDWTTAIDYRIWQIPHTLRQYKAKKLRQPTGAFSTEAILISN